MAPLSAETLAAKVKAGELVSNQPYRERLEWLMENDPECTLSDICVRLHSAGFTGFAKRRGRGGVVFAGETSYLYRTLGMKAWDNGKVVKEQKSDRNPRRKRNQHLKVGDRYPGSIKLHIPPDLAQAFYEVLEMDPLVEQGILPERVGRKHKCPTCRWGGDCDQPSGFGKFGAFCPEHADTLGRMRDEFFTATGQLRGGRGQTIRNTRARKRGTAARGLVAVWDENAGEMVVA